MPALVVLVSPFMFGVREPATALFPRTPPKVEMLIDLSFVMLVKFGAPATVCIPKPIAKPADGTVTAELQARAPPETEALDPLQLVVGVVDVRLARVPTPTSMRNHELADADVATIFCEPLHATVPYHSVTT
jgi:hypothetical protein